MRSQSTIAYALYGEKKGCHLLKWLPSISFWGRIQTRLVASVGKKTAVYCCFCREFAFWAEQPAPAPCKLSCAYPGWGGEVFLGTCDLAVYEMACWIMSWQLSIPRPLQTETLSNFSFWNLGRTLSDPPKVIGWLHVSTKIGIPD